MTRSALAVLAAAAAAGCAGAEDVANGPLVDEQRGIYRGVQLGDSDTVVQRSLGTPAGGPGFAPAGTLPAEVGVPESIPARGTRPPEVHKYAHSAFLESDDRKVYALMVTEEHAHTTRGVAIGDDLDAAREAYDVRCVDVAGGESTSGVETYPSCSTTIHGKIRIWFGDDPIKSITLLSLEPDE